MIPSKWPDEFYGVVASRDTTRIPSRSMKMMSLRRCEAWANLPDN
jgi:hypothetical protein